MKRLFMAGLLLLAMWLLSSCDALRTIRGTGDITSETREVSDFSAVNLAGIGNVVVDYGERESLRIEAEDNLLPYLETEVEGDTLSIGIREGVNVIPTQGIFYYLTVRDLDEVQVSGLGNIDVPRLEGTTVALKISGGGDINVEEVLAKRLDVLLSGLGNLTIEGGEVANSDVRLTGAGNYNASDMASEVVSVEVTGLGSAGVWAQDALDAKITGGGSVQYKGKPQVTQEITGLGEVRAVGGDNG
jgi:hypothetical protein